MKLESNIFKPELLAPAGDLERLKYAVKYGADAVYLAGQEFGMRTASSNFSIEDLKAGISFAHSKGVKVYCACNTLPRNSQIDALPSFILDAYECKADAFIVSDIGVLNIIKKLVPEAEIHISTQAGIVNYAAANSFYELGAKRVILARELSLDEIKEIRDKTNPNLDIECFVHGSMCVSFSGRCLLSDYLVGRDANQGDCAQPCRWKYSLMEEKRPNQFFPIEEDDSGSHIMNASDLCMIEHVPELIKAGISSFKIEGRAKSLYYAAVITNAYRLAIDEFLSSYNANNANYKLSQWISSEVTKVSHRNYSPGFYFGRPSNAQNYENGGYIREYDIVGIVENSDGKNITLTQRNKFYSGDTLEILEPGTKPYSVKVNEMFDMYGSKIDSAPHAMMKVIIPSSLSIPNGVIVRKKKIV